MLPFELVMRVVRADYDWAAPFVCTCQWVRDMAAEIYRAPSTDRYGGIVLPGGVFHGTFEVEQEPEYCDGWPPFETTCEADKYIFGKRVMTYKVNIATFSNEENTTITWDDHKLQINDYRINLSIAGILRIEVIRGFIGDLLFGRWDDEDDPPLDRIAPGMTFRKAAQTLLQ